MNPNVYEPIKPIVETKYGKLRGVSYGGLQIFMGIPYAKAGRFQMPVEPDSWEGVKNALKYGHISHQIQTPQPPMWYRGLFMHQIEGEDCQNLNIWAPKCKEGEKKPVFVWIHGGGWFAGNAVEEYSFDGFNLAQAGDVVFVSINHRLNLLGYLNLADYGEEFSNSVNVGLADLVAAMKWIHENIAAFGGDPENVTICGHSGGGGKVLTLFQMEEAAPYFQKGICLSGVGAKAPATQVEDSKAIAKAILDKVGITKENIQDVYTIPYRELAEAYRVVAMDVWAQGHEVNWCPKPNDYFPGFPLDAGFMPWSAHKPLLITSTLGEFGGGCTIPVEDRRDMTVEEKENYFRNLYGEKADKLMELFRKAYPTHDILDLAYLDLRFRPNVKATAEAKAALGYGNTYVGLSAYNMAEDEGIPMWHGGDVCYIFLNEDRVFCANEAIHGPKKAAIFSSSVINFCRNGAPGNENLPAWDPYTNEHPVTMVVDVDSEAKEDYDKELLEYAAEVFPKFIRKPVYAIGGAKLQIGVD